MVVAQHNTVIAPIKRTRGGRRHQKATKQTGYQEKRLVWRPVPQEVGEDPMWSADWASIRQPHIYEQSLSDTWMQALQQRMVHAERTQKRKLVKSLAKQIAEERDAQAGPSESEDVWSMDWTTVSQAGLQHTPMLAPVQELRVFQ